METLWLGKCWRSSKHRNRNRNKLIESLNGRQKRPKYIDLLESYSVLILDARARQVLPGEVAERDMCIYIYDPESEALNTTEVDWVLTN